MEQSIHLRLWSDQVGYIHRTEWDSEEVFNKLNRSRVMLRYHFDLANLRQSGPKYHVQVGGNARMDEVCWFPEIIDLPRLACPPMDLILVCQLIAANFYQEEYNKSGEDPQWISTIRRSQTHLLSSYYRDCHNWLQQEQILLDHLWNV